MDKRLPWLPLSILGVFLFCAIFAPLLAPHDPTQLDILNARIPPGRNASFMLGTDTLGRDILSRLIYGARTSAVIALVGLSASGLVGTLIGIASAYHGGKLDAAMMRIVDTALAFPTILVALVVAVVMGLGPATIVAAVTITMWAKFARMIRGDGLAVRKRDFVTLAQISGVRTPTIMARHILPNVTNTLLVVASLLLGQVILLESALSFLGLGLPPGAPSWGIMVAEGRALLQEVWWLSLFPGLAITMAVTAMNLLGDWLRDTLDPRLHKI